ncbi:glycolate oxidase iron-sulfur subunit [Melghirimyces algeriensis]|uniref:Glycolate oxidase iron-sulfur subunit n=2 Tax=Melghirimyces algeriensis TaxID=910412 RepID=A0A521F876_9BACL|nr:glycolate oxidase iron-sulfur subunit [Melghirimyces algeriensis]
MKQTEEVKQAFEQRMDHTELMNCMRCGFCLPSCPTYVETGDNEAASPRGRIALMKGVVDGLIEPDEEVEKQLNLCLGCRACEPVCPSGVQYGHLLEEARDILEQHKQRPLHERALRRVVFHWLFPNHKRIRQTVSLLYLYQKTGLKTWVQKMKINQWLPKHLDEMQSILPNVPSPAEMKHRPAFLGAKQPVRKRVAFFSGCLMDTLFMSTNDATLTLLQLAGCEVVIPKTQGCCGALHGHSGEKEKAKELAKRNIAAFESLDVDAIVTNAGGCGAFLTEYQNLFQDEPKWRKRAEQFTGKIKDFSEILVECGFHKAVPLSMPEQMVTYQESCHLRNVMRISQAPRLLLESIDHVNVQELPENQYCCGSAGIYNIVQPELSMKILDRKMKQVQSLQPSLMVTANPGCLLQMRLGVKQAGLECDIRVEHLADVLLESVPQEMKNHGRGGENG